METIQQMIKKFDLTKDKQVYCVITERIKNDELLWASYTPDTNNYYLAFENGKPSCYIFTEKKYYDEYQDYMMQQQIFVNPAENNKEQRMLMFSDLYRSGFELPYGVNITLTKDMIIVIESVAKGSQQNTVIKEQVH